jgi:heptose I phosphotransferase
MTGTGIEIVEHDRGRLAINRRFAAAFEANRLTTFDAIFNFAGGRVVRSVGSRSTAQILLNAGGAGQRFYLKRHSAASLVERVKPVIHLSQPILGARNEWEAILRFHSAGIPTMTPVAFGESGGRSLVMTEDLGTSRTLLDWVNETAGSRPQRPAAASRDVVRLRRELVEHVASIARRMHAAGLFHQDFYLNHMLCCGDPNGLDIRVIDLGRVRERRGPATRWVMKDLAQLDYSARALSCADRLRFLRLYLGRPFQPADRWIIRWIALKSAWIASHTAKNGL